MAFTGLTLWDYVITLSLSNFGNLPFARRTTARTEYGHNNFTSRCSIRIPSSTRVHFYIKLVRDLSKIPLATESGSGYDAAFLKSRRRGVLTTSQLWHSPAGRTGRSMQVSYNSSLFLEPNYTPPLRSALMTRYCLLPVDCVT